MRWRTVTGLLAVPHHIVAGGGSRFEHLDAGNAGRWRRDRTSRRTGQASALCKAANRGERLGHRAMRNKASASLGARFRRPRPRMRRGRTRPRDRSPWRPRPRSPAPPPPGATAHRSGGLRRSWATAGAPRPAGRRQRWSWPPRFGPLVHLGSPLRDISVPRALMYFRSGGGCPCGRQSGRRRPAPR